MKGKLRPLPDPNARIRELEQELTKLAQRVLQYVHQPSPELEEFLDCDMELRAMAESALKLVRGKKP